MIIPFKFLSYSFSFSSFRLVFFLTRNQKASQVVSYLQLQYILYSKVSTRSLRLYSTQIYIHLFSVPRRRCNRFSFFFFFFSLLLLVVALMMMHAVKVTTCSTAANIYSSRRQMCSEPHRTPQEAKDLSAPASAVTAPAAHSI